MQRGRSFKTSYYKANRVIGTSHCSCGTPQIKSLLKYPSSGSMTSPRIFKHYKHIILVWNPNNTHKSNRCTTSSSSATLTISPSEKKIWDSGSKMVTTISIKIPYSVKKKLRWLGQNTLHRKWINTYLHGNLQWLWRRCGLILEKHLSRKKRDQLRKN